MATARMSPTYTASTLMRILTSSSGLGTWQQYDVAYTERLMGSYARIAVSEPIIDEVTQRLDLGEIPAVSVEVLANTELMSVTVEHREPMMAAVIANALAEVLIERGPELYTGNAPTATDILLDRINQIDIELREARALMEELANIAPQDDERISALAQTITLKEGLYADLLRQYEEVRTADVLRANRVYVVEPASAPTKPSKPNRPVNLALGLAGGLAAGLGLAFLAEHMDRRLFTSDAIQARTGLPIIGSIPDIRWRHKPMIYNHPSPQHEAYRRLRANILSIAGNAPPRTLLVTSAQPREGKSTVTANLAFALAKSGHRVVVVDADLRRPRLHTIFGLPNAAGLGAVLEQETTLDTALQATSFEGVTTLVSGPSAVPVELLDSERMTEILNDLTHQFDMVLIDTPAFLAVMDAILLAPKVDAVLLVVGRAIASGDRVQDTCTQLGNTNAPLIGVVVNRARGERTYRYYN
ncbi:MAG: polysaccharide biosynthesis tyrosine autokinase [Chloroflexi bacterium]|nr:polysaccharide biosynthesis tyrosine autokinase [Chloroflexota bacterium]